jgi:hypothetical protein
VECSTAEIFCCEKLIDLTDTGVWIERGGDRKIEREAPSFKMIR